MKIKRFTLATALLIALIVGAIGVASRANAAAVCSPATAISVPYAKDGVGDICVQATSLCTYINSWNTTTVEINGTAYTNLYAAAGSIAPLNGGYTIHYVSSVPWGHFEIGGTCAISPTVVSPTTTKTLTPNLATMTRTLTVTPTPERTITRAASLTRTHTVTSGPSLTPSRTITRTNTAIPLTRTVTITLSRTPTPGLSNTPTATLPAGTSYVGSATWFTNLGAPYGGCGITQSALDTPHFVALNVQNSPGDYSTFLTRPIAPQFASQIGFWNNGLNCGRWVRVTISDYCTGVNDGAPNQAFCRNGAWVADAYNGATLDMIIADSCHDGNAWCRDDANHVDLAEASLNQFVKNGVPVGDMNPAHWGNRHVSWQFIPAPNYTGDIEIAFIQGAQVWWPAIVVNHLPNGLHGVEYFANGAWTKATMNGDMGQSYIIAPTTTGGLTYQLRAYDVNDQLINAGRIYNFSFPSATCGSQCSGAYNEVVYTIQ